MKEEGAPECFPVSVKGVLKKSGRFLLRKNEREEYELLGGRLEIGDRSFEARLHTEFLEESGIEIEVQQPLEPWTLAVGQSCVFILPYHCRALHIPDILCDQDGGSLAWFDPSVISRLPMPQGYRDSLFSLPPRSSVSRPAADRAGWIKTGAERSCPVFIQLWKDGRMVLERPLSRFYSPREMLSSELKNGSAGRLVFQECRIDRRRKAVISCYLLTD
ncbi:MAG: hypothetical protein HFG27_04920 [Provencibacterium sp.]|nr:hypothetical protein [Provencibacterium sp.]